MTAAIVRKREQTIHAPLIFYAREKGIERQAHFIEILAITSRFLIFVNHAGPAAFVKALIKADGLEIGEDACPRPECFARPTASGLLIKKCIARRPPGRSAALCPAGSPAAVLHASM